MKSVLLAIVALVVIGAGVLIYRHVSTPAPIASVGDCLAGQSIDALKAVPCGVSSARWRVVGKVDRAVKPVTDADMIAVCGAWPGTSTAFWQGSGDTGYVLCLVPTA